MEHGWNTVTKNQFKIQRNRNNLPISLIRYIKGVDSMTKEQQIKEVLKLMNETLDNNEWKELLKIYLELKG